MDEYNLKETKQTETGSITYTWHPKEIIDGVPAWQIYVFCILPDNKIVLVRDSGETRFTPPGGRIDPGEDPLTAAKREVLEEAQIELSDLKLLGSLEIENPSDPDEIQKHHLQVRYIAHIESMPDFVPNKDGWETEERIVVDVNDLPANVSWLKYPSGEVQYRMLLHYLDGKIEL